MAPERPAHPRSSEDSSFVLSSPSWRLLAVCFAIALVLPMSANAASDDAGSSGSNVAELAVQYVGSPYRWGGASPAGFDCTGFVQWVFSQVGVWMPRSEAAQLATGRRISVDELEPGDVLVFANTYRAGLSHVGIYLGEGEFVHAVDERHGVMVSRVYDAYWAPRLVGASRALA
jgi:cell wall-associated NlpC family hydrolase